MAVSFEGASILVPPNFVKFYLFFIFTYLKNFRCLASQKKKLNLGELVWGKPNIVAIPIFVVFYITFMPTKSENSTYLALTIQKFELLNSHLKEISKTWHLRFQAGTSTFGYLNSSQYDPFAFCGLKEDSNKRKK